MRMMLGPCPPQTPADAVLRTFCFGLALNPKPGTLTSIEAFTSTAAEGQVFAQWRRLCVEHQLLEQPPEFVVRGLASPVIGSRVDWLLL